MAYFFPEFPIIVCGLDSIQARRWMNGMIVGQKFTALKFEFTNNDVNCGSRCRCYGTATKGP